MGWPAICEGCPGEECSPDAGLWWPVTLPRPNSLVLPNSHQYKKKRLKWKVCPRLMRLVFCQYSFVHWLQPAAVLGMSFSKIFVSHSCLVFVRCQTINDSEYQRNSSNWSSGSGWLGYVRIYYLVLRSGYLTPPFQISTNFFLNLLLKKILSWW